MPKQIINKYLIFLLCVILAALTSAFIIEYGLGHKPCNLCLYQRIPYIVSVFLIIEILFLKKYVKTSLLLLFLLFIFSSSLAFYHLGIEQNIFNESFMCESKNFSETISKEQLLKDLKKNTISCKDVSFRILGFSLAAINMIFSIILSTIFIKLLLNYEKN